MAERLGNALVVVTLVGCLASLGVVVSFLQVVRRHRALRARGLAEEREALQRPLPPDGDLPHVVVQIVSFNEGALVERSIANAAALDWPADKLHVQVLDDSTDVTLALAADAAERERARGVDVSVLHRQVRREFKGGALQEGMARTGHPYFLVFDVDYVCPRDFLRRCMRPLLADPGLGFVQARLEVFNHADNLLTRAQRVVLDFSHGFDQALRSWSGGLVPFYGTGGVWRRDAIESAGGWSGATLSEDLDLTCRAWLKGWRGMFLSSVTASGEAPGRLRVWMSQQRRWMSGIGEVALRMLPPLVARPNGRTRSPWAGASPLAFWLACVTVVGTLVAAVGAVLADPSSAPTVGVAVALMLGALTALLFVLLRAANRFLRPGTPLWRFTVDFLPVPSLMLYLAWASFRSIPKTLIRRRRVFARTPKSVPAS